MTDEPTAEEMAHTLRSEAQKVRRWLRSHQRHFEARQYAGYDTHEEAQVRRWLDMPARHGVRDRVLDAIDTVINALTDAGFMIAVADAPAKSAEGGTGTQQADDDADELAEEIAGVDKDKIAKTVRGFIACGIVPPKPRKPKKERRRKETKKPLAKKVPTNSESSS